MNSEASDGPRYPLSSVGNALRLILLFQDHGRVTVAGAADQLGVARSTAHRLLSMLQLHGFVRQAPDRAYLPGPALLDTGLAVLRGMDLRTAAKPIMERLAAELGETVHLAILRNNDILFIECAEGPRILRVSCRTGSTLPAECTAAGRAMLAKLDPEHLRQIYPQQELRALTEHSLATRDALEKECRRIKARGYAVNDRESVADVRAVAAAIPIRVDGFFPALTVSAPANRLLKDSIPDVAAATSRAVREVAEVLSSSRTGTGEIPGREDGEAPPSSTTSGAARP